MFVHVFQTKVRTERTGFHKHTLWILHLAFMNMQSRAYLPQRAKYRRQKMQMVHLSIRKTVVVAKIAAAAKHI